MLTPALQYPATVLSRLIPVAVAEKTMSSRVCDVNGIDSPLRFPDEMVPTARVPVNEGAKVTVAPGIAVNVLFGVGELNKVAVMVNVVPSRFKAAVVLK
ncbi:hypothetical protein BCV73_27335 [Paenibacillus sp. SSG-1]|nr:hypothetical protein BCV73_27335 [Paenibacillus sp. SSG-1]